MIRTVFSLGLSLIISCGLYPQQVFLVNEKYHVSFDNRGMSGLVCRQGDALGSNSHGQPVACSSSCLHKADCIVDLRTPSRGTFSVERCAPEKFNNPADKDCGSICPCWRVIPKPADCKPEVQGSPYGLEILRRGPAEKGSEAVVKCASSPHRWGTPSFADLPQCS